MPLALLALMRSAVSGVTSTLSPASFSILTLAVFTELTFFSISYCSRAFPAPGNKSVSHSIALAKISITLVTGLIPKLIKSCILSRALRCAISVAVIFLVAESVVFLLAAAFSNSALAFLPRYCAASF